MRRTKRIHRISSLYFFFPVAYELQLQFFLSLSSCFLFFFKYRRRWPWLRTALVAETKAVPLIFDTDKGTVISLVRSVISSLSCLFRAYIKYPTRDRTRNYHERIFFLFSFLSTIFTSTLLGFLLQCSHISTDNTPQYTINLLWFSDRYAFFLLSLSLSLPLLFLFLFI